MAELRKEKINNYSCEMINHKTKNKSLNITLIVVVVIKMLDEKKIQIQFKMKDLCQKKKLIAAAKSFSNSTMHHEII